MQIHELNSYSGSLDSDACVAVDNGVDTGKVPITELIEPLNERIDNILTSPAPSAQEIIDARLGANGVTYSSLGLAIRSQINILNADISSKAQGLANLLGALFFSSHENMTFTQGTRGASSGSSVAVSSSSIWACSSLVPVAQNDIFTVVNTMPDKFRFAIRGYTENEANNGVMVAQSFQVLDSELVFSGDYSTAYSNAIAAVIDNTIEICKSHKEAIKYLSIHVRPITAENFVPSDLGEIQSAFRLYRTSPEVNYEYLPNLGSYGTIVGYGPIRIDTINKTVSSGGSYTVKYGKAVFNNVAFDFSELDPTVYQTIYYDIDANVIKIVNYRSYASLPNVERTVYLGSTWAANSYYPDAYYAINTNVEILVNGKKQLLVSDYNIANASKYRSIALFGDSIMQGQTTSGNKTDYLMQNLIPRHWGIDATNYAIGGSGWCQREGRTADLAVKVPDTDVSEYDYILFFSGTNDYGAGLAVGSPTDAPSGAIGAGFCASVKYVLENVIIQNPDAEIAIVTPTFRNYQSYGGTGNTYTEVRNQAGNTLGEFCDALVDIGEMYNIPVYDMRKNSPINFRNYATMLHEQSSGSGTYLHPRNETYRILYHKIMQWLEVVY